MSRWRPGPCFRRDLWPVELRSESPQPYQSMPWWRFAQDIDFPCTEEMVVDVNSFKAGKPEVSIWESDEALLKFVGVVCRTRQWLVPEDVHGKDLVEYHLETYDVDFSAQDKADVRGLTDAVMYAQSHMSSARIELQELVEVDRLVMGGNFQGDVFRTPEASSRLTETVLPELNAVLAELGDDDCGDALPRIQAAALFFARFRELNPFTDGNARVSKVVMAVILKDGVFPFPFQTFNLDSKILYHGRIREALFWCGGTHFMPLVIAYIIERAWLHQRQVRREKAAACSEQQNLA